MNCSTGSRRGSTVAEGVSQGEFDALLAAHRATAAEVEALKLRLAYVEGWVRGVQEALRKDET